MLLYLTRTEGNFLCGRVHISYQSKSKGGSMIEHLSPKASQKRFQTILLLLYYYIN